MSNVQYPYRASFPRTGDWYSSEGTWYRISTWCNTAFGAGNWNYYGNDFVFERESDYMLFILKWQEQRSGH